MKLFFLLLFLIAYIHCAPCDMQCLIDSQPIAQRCSNGYHVNRDCCVANKAAWYTELIPLDEIDTIQIVPYTCANPSFCDVLYSRYGIDDDWWSGNQGSFRDTTNVPQYDDEHGNVHFSGAQYSCGTISFILCKNRGIVHETNLPRWECYGKFDNDSMTMIFTQSLQCLYTEIDNRTMLQVGSCVINQASVLEPASARQKYRPYALLSSTSPISFTPILNPSEVDALRSQTGINRIIRKSDAIVATAYLPPPVPLVVPSVLATSSCPWVILLFGGLFSFVLCLCTCCICGLCGAANSTDQRVAKLEYSLQKQSRASVNAALANLTDNNTPSSMYPSKPFTSEDIQQKV